MKNTIVVPTDFTGFGEAAIRQAVAFAKIYDAEIELLHVREGSAEAGLEAEQQMQDLVTAIKEANNVPCTGKVLHGSLFEVLDNATCESEQYCLMLLVSKNAHGTAQTISNKDVLKLAAHVHIPIMVVQEDSPLVENITSIVLPVASHSSFGKAVDAVMLLSWPDETEIHLYSVYKPGFEWPEELVKNIDDTTKMLEENNMKLIRVKEEQKVYSPGYAKQTLNYAGSIGADLICIMSQASEQYYYIAHSDKESILNNESHIPVLIT